MCFDKKNIKFKTCDTNLNIVCRHDSLSGDVSVGRIISLELNNNIIVVSTYIPKSGYGRSEQNYHYRTKIWDPALYQYLNNMKNNNKNVVWIGDINVASNNIDVYNPGIMCNYSGFSKLERNNLNKFYKNDWYDVWRLKNNNVKKYTHIGYKPRENYGMRIDNIIVTKNLLEKTEKCNHSK